VSTLASHEHEAEVAFRFDRLESRFKVEVGEDDVRLNALRACLDPVRGRRILDLGCGKGRFAVQLVRAGGNMIGLDRSLPMLARAGSLPRVRGTARRLPFAAASFDAVIAIEVFEHIAAVDEVLLEVRRVLRPGGIVAIVDKNAGSWNAFRPWLPNLAAKWIDEQRERWMYPKRSLVRERWFWPWTFRKRLRRFFDNVQTRYLLSPAEADCPLFRHVPALRLFALWSARVPDSRAGGVRV
jgi:2-polyprenyl-6-hydroxyphenyl methylase/3-demethylubiquinone-9 3-methyltransferase